MAINQVEIDPLEIKELGSNKPSESWAMSERQKARKNGRYTKMWTCEVCAKPLGPGSYYSAASCNDTGRGVVLCKKCCAEWDAREQKQRS